MLTQVNEIKTPPCKIHVTITLIRSINLLSVQPSFLDGWPQSRKYSFNMGICIYIYNIYIHPQIQDVISEL